jgi:hypothetical protein
MLLGLIKRALKAALHQATEEWLLEIGLPAQEVAEMRARRLAHAERAQDLADDKAATRLGLDEEDAPAEPPALPMPAAARITGPAACPHPDAGEDALMAWVHTQREQSVSWAEITKQANEAGHSISEDALRGRHRRFKDKAGQPAE